MRGYSTRLTGPVGPVAVLVVVLLLVALLPVPARANYELYRQHRQRQQMERQTQMRHHEEKKSEFVKGKRMCAVPHKRKALCAILSGTVCTPGTSSRRKEDTDSKQKLVLLQRRMKRQSGEQ
uniref:Secreted protein n=1 Tax=Anopheles melas TaxID=34690 RepID=A0A182UDK2_9DIPT